MADDIVIGASVTGITNDERRLYRRLRNAYPRPLAVWAYLGYRLPVDDMQGPALMIACNAAYTTTKAAKAANRD